MPGIFNSSCVLCGGTTKRSISLCESCQNDLPKVGSSCNKCGIPHGFSNNDSIENICGQCLKNPPVVDYTLSMFNYESPVNYLITQLKFNQQLSCASILGYLLMQHLSDLNRQNDLPDVILPVPLHKQRLLKRGFNQSLEIARLVSKRLNIPVDHQIIRRSKSTLAQTDLNASQRKKNIKGCFELDKVSTYKHVVIIDDVVTTGATTNELAKVLKKSGVTKVGVWTIARAILN